MINLEAMVLPDRREKTIISIKNSLSDICSTRKIIIDSCVLVPPFLLSISPKSKYHFIVPNLHDIFSKEGYPGVSDFVESLGDFYFDYINILADFIKRENVFMLKNNYIKLKERINRLKRRKRAAKSDIWEEFILDKSLSVYRYIHKVINDAERGRKSFIIPGLNYEDEELRPITKIINGRYNGHLSEKDLVANLFYLRYDGFSQNRWVLSLTKKCYKEMKYIFKRKYYPRILSINFEKFCVNSHDICN